MPKQPRTRFPIDWEPIQDVRLEITLQDIIDCFGDSRAVLRELAEQETASDILGQDDTIDSLTWLGRKLAKAKGYEDLTYFNRYSGLVLINALAAITDKNLVGFSESQGSYTLFPVVDDIVQRSNFDPQQP